jgi:muramidase (phage lysozyme)
MTFTDKLNLSTFIIKRAYAGYTAPAAAVTSEPVPKAIPVARVFPAPQASSLYKPRQRTRTVPQNTAPVTQTPAPVVRKSTPVVRNSTVPQTSGPAYYQPILDVIRKGEANTAGYDTMVGSNKPFGLTGKTLQQVLDIQKERLKTYGGTAAGGYQILNKNLKGLAAQHKHDLNKTIFDQKTQDTYGRSLMDRRGFKDFLAGKINPDQMRINLAKEWAALPAKGERSYYHGTGNNAARVPSKEINAAIAKSLELYRKATAPKFFNQVGELP